MSAPLSVLIAVRNEERNLEDCLRSAAFADEVVVVDSGSVDATRAIAERMGATVVDFPGVPETGSCKRTWAIDTYPFRNDWILVLDADERLTPELAAEMTALLADGCSCDAYQLLFRYYFLGRWIRHCGWYPAYQVRLFRRGRAAYRRPDFGWSGELGDVEVHERIETAGPVGRLREHLLHYDYKGVGNWVDKHNRYSSWEAARRRQGVDRAGAGATARRILSRDPVDRRLGLRQFGQRLPARPVATFVWMYVVKRGFLDGYPGLVFCAFHAIHQLHVDLKTAELAASSDGGT